MLGCGQLGCGPQANPVEGAVSSFYKGVGWGLGSGWPLGFRDSNLVSTVNRTRRQAFRGAGFTMGTGMAWVTLA